MAHLYGAYNVMYLIDIINIDDEYSGWIGSEMKYLNKYSKLWNQMNCSTMNVIDKTNFVRQIYFDNRTAEVSEFIIKQLIKGRF